MKPLPAHLPPLPENAAFLGLPDDFKNIWPKTFEGWMFDPEDEFAKWYYSRHLLGDKVACHYAAPKDSPIAILNGLGEPEVDWKKRAEEWESLCDKIMTTLIRSETWPTAKEEQEFVTTYEALKSKEKP